MNKKEYMKLIKEHLECIDKGKKMDEKRFKKLKDYIDSRTYENEIKEAK